MTKDEHIENLRVVQKMAREAFLKQGHHIPQIININKDGGWEIMVIADMENDEHKDMLAELMKQLVEKGSQAVIFIGEAWTVVQPNTDLKEALKIRPSQHPDRIEVLMVQCSTSAGELITSAPIIREVENNPWDRRMAGLPLDSEKPKLGEWTGLQEQTDWTVGRFSNIWGQVRQKHSQDN
jgi:hypothetical protein